MKILVAGSRGINPETIVFTFSSLLDIFSVSEFVTGCARGADQIPYEYNNIINSNREIPIKEFPADWDKFGKSAGYVRNREMAEYCDAAIIIWDGKSKGTKHMIDIMFEYPDKPTIIYKVI